MSENLPPTYVEGFHDLNAVKRMIYTPFGKTGMKFSCLGLGGGPFSNTLYGKSERDEINQTINYALRNGVNFIETAPWYGQGNSEKNIGEALKNLPREAYYIATKVGRYELEISKMFDFSAKKVRESVSNSLSLLGLNYVDLIQVHDIEFAPNLDIIVEETLPTLEECVNQGQAKFIGITGYPLSTLKYLCEKSKISLSSILTYTRQTICDHSLSEMVDEFTARGMGIICAAPVAMGLLTNAGPPSWHPASQKLKDLAKQASNLCKEKNIQLAKLAVYYTATSIPREKVQNILIGVQSKKELEQNLDVILNGLNPLEKETLSEIEKLFTSLQPSERHWEGVELAKYKLQLK